MSDWRDLEAGQSHVHLIVTKQHVKAVKSALEHHNLLDKTRKIVPDARDQFPHDTALQTDSEPASTAFTSSSNSTEDNVITKGNVEKKKNGTSTGQQMRIPTTIPYPFDENELDETSHNLERPSLKERILSDLALVHLQQDISIGHHTTTPNNTAPTQRNPVLKALQKALDSLPPSRLCDLDLTTSALVSSFPETYSIYKPMLLLPHKAFSSPPWTQFLSVHPFSSPTFQSLFAHISSSTHTTHIAILSPIPDIIPTSLLPAASNILRRPQNLTPLYGTFGPVPTTQTETSPTNQDFSSTLWVTTTQNSIHQTWAPLYTMFSRGNIREKTRVLHLPSVTSSPYPTTAVDLYAGIGYFSFSYLLGGGSGRTKLLCWELNPWSIEGLRRGAHLNGWTSRVYLPSDIPTSPEGWSDFKSHFMTPANNTTTTTTAPNLSIFQMDNTTAPPIISHIRPLIPPIRHVNLGLLPDSRLAWHPAVRILDPRTGGWVHVHENVGTEELAARTKEVEECFQRIADACEGGDEVGGTGVEEEEEEERTARSKTKVWVEHVERVKTYAPGVLHVVFDVCVQIEVGAGEK